MSYLYTIGYLFRFIICIYLFSVQIFCLHCSNCSMCFCHFISFFYIFLFGFILHHFSFFPALFLLPKVNRLDLLHCHVSLHFNNVLEENEYFWIFVFRCGRSQRTVWWPPCQSQWWCWRVILKEWESLPGIPPPATSCSVQVRSLTWSIREKETW